MKWALVDKDNIVVNVIVYSQGSDFVPPEGIEILEVNDWLNIGDNVDKLKPAEMQPKPQNKKDRNMDLANNLAVVAAFELEKKSNAVLNFGDYIDTLLIKSADLKSDIDKEIIN